MIAKLKGKIDELKPTELIIDVNGVGFLLSIPFITYESIRESKDVMLYVYTLHKEDQFKLYGFSTLDEKKLFSTLIDINGVGPVMALSILSGISINMLVEAVKNNKVELLTKIPGIGKTKAEKLIFELERKIKNLEDSISAVKQKPSVINDAVDALMSLGYDETRSSNIVEEILQENPELTIEIVIKKALKFLST